MAAQDKWREFIAVWARPRWRAALAVAALSDMLSFGLEVISLGLAEPVQIAVDLITAVAILALLGFRWGMAIPLIMEAMPMVAAFPTWTLAVLAYSALEGPRALPPSSSAGQAGGSVIDVEPGPPGA